MLNRHKRTLSCATSLRNAALVSAFIAITTPMAAFAQDAAPGCVDTNKDGVCDTNANDTAIVVTGSRIRKDEYTTAEPLTVITSDEMTQAGFNSATEALQSNQITQGSAQINNYFAGFVVDGGTGVNTLSLRGLGPARTLLLLNGHRLAPAGTRGSVGSVDTNVLPTAMINRIEVLKAGASSIYGSDAIAGVVNVITDRKLDGLVLEGQANVPNAGAGSSYRLSASFGYNGDRFHILGSLEYYKRNSMARRDRSFTQCPIGGYLSGEGTALGSGDYIDPATGEPACFTLDNGGVTINTLGVSGRNSPDRLTGTIARYTRLVPDASNTSAYTPGYSGVTYYTRDSFDPEQEKEELVTPVEIITGYFEGGYELQALGNAELYFEFLGNRRESSALLYRQLTLDYGVAMITDSNGDPIAYDTSRRNPLVPSQFWNSLFAYPNDITNGDFVGVRSFIGFGNTQSKQRVDFYRTAGGLRGELPFQGWRYDLYGSYSWTRAKYDTETFLTDRIAQSLNVVQNTDGSFSCVDPSGGCVAAPPVNAASIGGQLSDAYRNYILQNVVGTTKFDEIVTSFNVDGPLFSLPGGTAKAALGVEYRHSKIDDTPPLDSINGNLYNLTSATPTRGSDSVWEVYGEVDLPLISDVPGIHRLSLDLSGRYTHYRSYGGDWTYKVAGEWEPVSAIGFRASYGTSYRAPALFEQFLGATSGFISSSSDPCDDYANSGNPNILANCAAIGLPSDFTQTSGITVLNAGGAASGLKAETSKNFSAGVVLKPPLPSSLGSLSMALDYFDIEVNNGVSRVGATNILNRCYDVPSFNPTQGFCRLVSRDANNRLTVNNNYINLSTDKVKGFEFNLRYQVDIGPGRLLLNALVTKYTEQSSRLFADDPLNDANGIITQPDWTGSFDATYRVGKVTLRYGLDWVGSDHSRTYNYISLDDAGVVDPDTLDFVKQNYYLEVPNYFLHSVSVQFDVGNFELTAGVKNLFDKDPPRISADIFSLIGNAPLYSGYDYVGRTFFVNATAKF